MSADEGLTSDIENGFVPDVESADSNADDAMEISTVKHKPAPKLTQSPRRRRDAQTRKQVDRLRSTIQFMCGMI